MKTKRILAIIPARGGSKGIKYKNIKYLAGKPLIQYTIDEAKKVSGISEVVVSTDSERIAKISKGLGALVPCLRPPELAGNFSLTLPAIIHMTQFMEKLRNVMYDYVLTLQPTSPLRTASDIRKAIKVIIDNPQADSLVSVVKVPHNFAPESIMVLKKGFLKDYIKQRKRTLRRQDKKTYHARNGAAIYITKRELLNKGILVGNIIPFLMNYYNSFDIDGVEDFKFIEKIMGTKK